MRTDNHTKAREHLLQQAFFIDFINKATGMVRQKCAAGIPFLDIEKEYREQLSKLDLSRLESFLLIIEIRDVLEEGLSEVPQCIDSFIDAIYTAHTGYCSDEWILRFKNEPEAPAAFRDYVESDAWKKDTSWQEKG